MLNKIREYINTYGKKRIIGFVLVLVILAALALTVIIAQNQQTIRQRASELVSPPSPPFPPPSSGSASVSISPVTLTKNVGETFTASINLDAGSNNISGVDITLTFNQNVLELTSFDKAPALANQLVNTINNQEGTFRYAATQTTSAQNTGLLPLGQAVFKAKAPGASQVFFRDVQVTALDFTGSLNIKTTLSTFIVLPTSTPTPTPPPSVTPTPTPSPLDTTTISLSGSLMGDPPRTPSGTVTIEIVSIDPVTKNVSFNLSGQLAGLPSNKIYKVYVCRRDRNECATNSNPSITTNTKGKANFDGIKFNLINTPENPISSVRVHDEKDELCPIRKTPCLQGNYSVPIPTVTPKGAYSFHLSNTQTKITCTKGDPNCKYTTVLIAKNKIDKPLYKTTIYTSDPNQTKTLTHVDFDGTTKTGQGTPSSRVVLPGEEAVNTYITFTPPADSATYNAILYMDGQTCNINTSPPDCIFYGASSLDIKMNTSGNTVTIEVVNNSPAVLSSPTPTPTPLPPTPTPTPAPIANLCTACSADVNKNGIVNTQDIGILNTCLNQPVSGKCVNADINRDGKVDALDLACVGKNQGKSCSQQTTTPTSAVLLGDADGNGTIDILDYNIWREEFLGRLQTKKADFNKDGKVDLIDFGIWRNAFNPPK